MTKKKLLITLSILATIIIIGMIVSLSFVKKDNINQNKIINKIIGTYNITDSLYRTEPIQSTTFKYAKEQYLKQQVLIQKDKVIIKSKDDNDDEKIEREAKYIIKEIDNEFLDNGWPSQGLALRNGLIEDYESLKKIKDKYAIFIEKPAIPDVLPTEQDFMVIYYLDGKIYFFFRSDVLVLEKAN